MLLSRLVRMLDYLNRTSEKVEMLNAQIDGARGVSSVKGLSTAVPLALASPHDSVSIVADNSLHPASPSTYLHSLSPLQAPSFATLDNGSAAQPPTRIELRRRSTARGTPY